MTLVVVSIYLAAVLFCVGTTAWILRAWTRRRYWHKSPSDLHYVVAGTALLLSAGIGVAIASQIVVALGHPSGLSHPGCKLFTVKIGSVEDAKPRKIKVG